MPQISSNFIFRSKQPNFERDSFKTLEEMSLVSSAWIDEGHISYCEEDGQIYIFSTKGYNSNGELMSQESSKSGSDRWTKLPISPDFTVDDLRIRVINDVNYKEVLENVLQYNPEADNEYTPGTIVYINTTGKLYFYNTQNYIAEDYGSDEKGYGWFLPIIPEDTVSESKLQEAIESISNDSNDKYVNKVDFNTLKTDVENLVEEVDAIPCFTQDEVKDICKGVVEGNYLKLNDIETQLHNTEYDGGYATYNTLEKIYATKESLESYATYDELGKIYATKESLESYATYDELGKIYATKESVENIENSYATKESVENIENSYATKESLESYATTESLGSYATKESLESYATTESVENIKKNLETEINLRVTDEVVNNKYVNKEDYNDDIKALEDSINDAKEIGKQLVLRELYKGIGIIYNDTNDDNEIITPWEGDGSETTTHKIKHYYLNGIGDLTDNDLINIYSAGQPDLYSPQPFRKFSCLGEGNLGIRTIIPGWLGADFEYGPITLEKAFYNCNKLNTIIFCRNSTNSVTLFSNDLRSAFEGCNELIAIGQPLNIESITDKEYLKNAFNGCSALKHINLIRLGVDLDLSSCINITLQSLANMIEYAQEKPINITLHPEAYARLRTEQIIEDKLSVKTNITLSE